MSDFVFRISPNIILGSYTASRAGQFARDWGSRYMVVIDPVLKETGTTEKILQSLRDRKIDFFTFEEVSADCDSQTISRAVTLARESHIHGIIAAGGDVTINAARAISAVFNDTHDLYDFVDGANPTTAPLPLICIPTTMRAPFIFTDRTPVIDARSQQVKLLKVQNGLCKMVIFDPNLTVTLTENQISTMTLETLCIAIESYISQKAGFFSDMIAEKAIELLGFGIDGASSLTVTTPQEILLSQGGCLASLSCATSAPGAASLISLCINARYKISRSLVTAILLPHIIDYCSTFKATRLQKAATLLRILTDETTPEQAAATLAENMRQRLAQANLPTRLKDLSISIEQLALCAEDAGQLEFASSLPRNMTADDLFDLIKLSF
jgi:alcohol dehydrogenase class IV